MSEVWLAIIARTTSRALTNVFSGCARVPGFVSSPLGATKIAPALPPLPPLAPPTPPAPAPTAPAAPVDPAPPPSAPPLPVPPAPVPPVPPATVPPVPPATVPPVPPAPPKALPPPPGPPIPAPPCEPPPEPPACFAPAAPGWPALPPVIPVVPSDPHPASAKVRPTIANRQRRPEKAVISCTLLLSPTKPACQNIRARLRREKFERVRPSQEQSDTHEAQPMTISSMAAPVYPLLQANGRSCRLEATRRRSAMPLVREIAEVIRMLAEVVKSTRDIVDAVNDGRKFLAAQYPQAKGDFSELLRQMEQAVVGLVDVTKVISGFRFVSDAGASNSAAATFDLVRFNDYVIAQKSDIATLRNRIRELKADCEKVRALRDKLDAMSGTRSWGSLFGLFGEKARYRSVELASALSNFYADDQRMISLFEQTLDLALHAMEEVGQALGPPGQANPANVPVAAQILGIYAVSFDKPQKELHALADVLSAARTALTVA